MRTTVLAVLLLAGCGDSGAPNDAGGTDVASERGASGDGGGDSGANDGGLDAAPSDAETDASASPLCVTYCDCMAASCAGRFATRGACTASCMRIQTQDPEALDCRVSNCQAATSASSTQCSSAAGTGPNCTPML